MPKALMNPVYDQYITAPLRPDIDEAQARYGEPLSPELPDEPVPEPPDHPSNPGGLMFTILNWLRKLAGSIPLDDISGDWEKALDAVTTLVGIATKYLGGAQNATSPEFNERHRRERAIRDLESRVRSQSIKD